MGGPHFSKFVDGRIGSFHHGLALVEATLSDEAMDLLHDPARLQRYTDEPDRQFRLLLELSSIAHERIHYLDTFGTIAGISLLAARIELLREFLEVGGTLAASRNPWQLPLSNWLKRPDVPQNIKKLAGLAFAHSQAVKSFVAAVEPFMVEGHTSDVWVHLPFRPRGRAVGKSPSIPAFPQSLDLRDGTGAGASRPVTVFHPLGYEAIIEGRAHAMARSWIESTFPDAPQALLANYGPPKAIPRGASPGELPMAAANQFEIYNMTDFMLSKFLRGRGVQEFPRDLVLRLSDRALSESIFHLRQLDARRVEVKLRSPGTVFVSLMEKMPPSAAPTVDYPEQITDLYRATLANFGKGGDWTTVTGMQPYKSLRMWESFVAQHISVPLLRQRLETDHAVYTRTEALMEFAMSPAHPRVEVVNGRLNFHHMPPEVRSAWAAQMFLGEIAEQVFAGATTIRCPRAHRLLPGLDTADFANGECRISIRRGCGSCTGGVPSHKVVCMFNQALHAYGLTLVEPPQSSEAGSVALHA